MSPYFTVVHVPDRHPPTCPVRSLTSVEEGHCKGRDGRGRSVASPERFTFYEVCET